MTLPEEPRTLPKRTEMNFVPFLRRRRRLDDPLAERLCLAEHVLGPDGLVRGDEDEALDAVLGGQLGEVPRAEDVVPHGLERVRLHERDVLCRRVEDDRRLWRSKSRRTLPGSLTSASAGTVAVVALALQLALDGDEGVLGMVDEDDASGAQRATWRQSSEPIEPPAPVTSTARR